MRVIFHRSDEIIRTIGTRGSAFAAIDALPVGVLVGGRETAADAVLCRCVAKVPLRVLVEYAGQAMQRGI